MNGLMYRIKLRLSWNLLDPVGEAFPDIPRSNLSRVARTIALLQSCSSLR
jgi:hypothetical protein